MGLRTNMPKTNVEKLEQHFGSLLFHNSDAQGICYATAADDNRIAIISEHGGTILLTEKQCHAVAKEIREIAALFVGRGRKRTT